MKPLQSAAPQAAPTPLSSSSHRKGSLLLLLLLFCAPAGIIAQTFIGTNSPGQGSNYTFTTTAAATNLSLVISNSASTYSYLMLKKGGAPSDTDFDFVARVSGQTNEINLELPEYAVTNYGVRVSTPGASATHSFRVLYTTNRTDLRSAAYPVLKPLAFTTTGSITNNGPGAWQYFQVDAPSNLLTGWRIVLSTNSPGGNPDLYVKRGSVPTPGNYDKGSANQAIDTMTFTGAEATTGTYFIGVYLGAVTNANYTLSAELASLTPLVWDPGTADGGTQIYTNQSASGGDYYFSINTAGTANGAWRTALKVLSGEADVYLTQGSLPTTTSYTYGSARVGSDGFVLAQGSQFSPGQTWYLLVHAQLGAQWTLMTGEAYVQQLPALAADASSGAAVTLGPEGVHYFKTTISSGTIAWRLGLNGLTNQLYVKTTAAPVPSSPSTYDLSQPGQMLVVPSYLSVGSQYFIGVAGNPGLSVTLDSRQHSVTNLEFSTTTNFSVTGYGYATFAVQVPVQQIAWQVNVTSSSGDASVAVRQNTVPNEFANDGFSEVPSPAADSITLVPPTLANGTFYVTVYGTPPYNVSLFNGQPAITDVPYAFNITNDAPARAGWRFYRTANTAEQLGSLGWQLDLSNHVAGTEIAIRRNAVPGRWNYRNNPNNNSTTFSTLGYVDVSSTLGFLQQPNHQADVWYIGVYTPATALGNFVLTGTTLTGPAVAFDGAGSSTNISGQPAGKFQYFAFTVPANTFGWDLRIDGATNGNPYLYVCRDALPSLNNPNGWNPATATTWSSGNQWQAGYDWTSDYYDTNGTYRYGQILEMGMGNPLQPGTYYAGVISTAGTSPINYTLTSRGIGTNMTIPIVSLPFTNGIVTTNLPGRELAYYSIVVPSNMPSWTMKLATNSGESLLMLQKDALPSITAAGSPPTLLYGGRKLQKSGNEQYLLMPSQNQTNIPAGTYYLAVASEGMNPSPPTIGTNSSSFTFTSFGTLSISNIGTVDSSGATDLIVTNSNEAGQHSAFQFTVPPGTLAIAVFLENRVGNPYMTLMTGNQLPYGTDGYGEDGGQGYSWISPTLINIPDPAATNYTLMVQSVASGGNASYRVRVHALLPSAITFDGGTANIVNQGAGVWQYFSVTVPANAFGWDLRLSGATNGNPYVYVCRDQLPSQSNPHGWNPSTATTWPSGYQWQAGYDWTSDNYDTNSMYRYGQILQMGMGNPLAPGTYYIGVISTAGTSPFSYTLTSRGIGTNMTIPVTSLPFTNGAVTASLPAREVAYYSIIVPTNLPSWRLKLGTNSGESLLMLQKDALPSVLAGGTTPTLLYGGRKLQKAGNEQYLLLPNQNQSNIIAGTYYLAVASEGMNPSPPTIGTNSSSFTLTSDGMLSVSNIGTVDNTGVSDILVTNNNEAGQHAAFQFAVPPNTLSLAISLENRVGNPYMTLKTGDQLPYGTDGYGEDGGQAYSWSSPTLINIANPVATNYTLMVQSVASGGDASYRARIHALGPQGVSGDGGSASVTNQAAGTWQYFVVNVPATVAGWDIRINGATNANPYLYVCRDQSPSQSNPNGWNPATSTTWPSGYQWQAGYDWTSEYYDSGTIYRYGQILQMGMGNPLVPGTYYIGIISTAGTSPFSYTLASRFIGTNSNIPLIDLPFTNGVSTNLSLNAREAAYYRVVVPTNVPNWKLRLANTSGECLIALQKDALPSVAAGGTTPTLLYGGRKLQKAGNEQYLLLPNPGQTNIVAGTYYLLVASEGVNPSPPTIGSNSCSYVLTSYGVQTVTNLGVVGLADILSTNNLQGGENALYRFSVPFSTNALEVRLDNVTGSPFMTLQAGSNAASPYDAYGNDGGNNYTWASPTLITLPNPTVTNYSLTVQASASGNNYPNALFTVHLRQIPSPSLTFDAALNTPVASNIVTGTLLDGQSAFYQVTVPATLNSQPVIGWRLDISQSSGAARIRVRPGATPDSSSVTTPFVSSEAIIVPSYLTPGTWFVEVRATGLTSYTLTSSNLQLKRPVWAMPVQGNPVTTPGLSPGGPLFGDSGVDTNGVPLAGDQGTDLAQGSFDYYTITVPPGNIGVLRTRLDAISGNPNLFIRVGAPSTLSHNSLGGNGSVLYERNLSAPSGSQYGNWVPVSGRYETYLTNATWYLAVQAGGSSNVRYRLRLYSGIVNDLALGGGSFSSQTLAAGDWLYYRVLIPTNAPNNWAVTFSEQLGNVVMYVRDRVPPGQGATTSDYKDWSDDNKNHSSAYASYDPPGTYTFTNPPVRPGNTYFVGFRAVNDATFSVSCNTNGGYIDYTNTVPFYSGVFTANVPANGTLKLRIDVPADARRLIMNFTNVSAFNLYLDQGAVPARNGTDPFASIGLANPVLNQPLYNLNGWPWLPNYMYFLFVTNTTASPQTFAFGVNGRNCATDDSDADGLPDCWELTYWSNIGSYNGNDDPDADGVRNLDEYLEGTDPTNPLSFHPRLTAAATNGVINLNPAGNATTTPPKVWFNQGQSVQLTAVPNAGYGFLGWSGDTNGSANPLTIVITNHLNIVAIFGVTNQPTADYLFQNNLHSSLGTPPDLVNIASGNSFIIETVDGNSRTVYRFAQGSSVALNPANGVIPTNIYTMVLLFRFDDVSGWRRILDFKNPPADFGLYQFSGTLNFYGGASGPGGGIANSNYVQVVITHDASSNVVGYVNGAQQFTFTDVNNYATLSGSPQQIRFFKDNTTEDGAGAMARIRLYDKVMPPAQVATLDRLPGGLAPLQFIQPFYYSNGVLYLSVQLTPGVNYRIQASTNLTTWSTISNLNSAISPILITDPAASSFSRRFYRGVTP
jgi:large repetitive protein